LSFYCRPYQLNCFLVYYLGAQLVCQCNDFPICPPVGSRLPSYNEVRDTPLSIPGVTPLRSIHVGDQLSRHNIHLQQTSPIPPSSQVI